jgi:hypothetical protein
MGAKILDIYNVLIGHGIPGNGKSLETLKLEVSSHASQISLEMRV